jgi:transglutaminase/protease-like cytokinesis protein 3
LFVLQSTFGQNLYLVDQKIETYPYYSNVNSIANRIEEDFPSKLEKIRAVYSWVSKNIKYDLKEFYSGAKQYSFRYSSKEELQRQIDKRNNSLISKTLKRQKAVCEGYSQTFKKICDILQIECKVVSGYTKTFASEIGKLPLGGRHAWNVVFINNEWKLIDTTWGAGYANEHNKWIQQFDDYFFFTSPEDLINSHFPEESKWQLLNTPYSSKQFADFPILTPHYFKNRLQLKFPKTGKLINRNNQFYIVKFNSDNISEDFSYAYGNDIYMSSLIPDLIRNETVLKIPAKNKKNTSLNIIVGNDVVLQYQIK